MAHTDRPGSWWVLQLFEPRKHNRRPGHQCRSDRSRVATAVHGEDVRSVPPNWMGGVFGKEIGWRVAQIVPGRAIVLEGWGAFVLVPTDQRTTRLLIRLRGPGTPSLQSVALSPLGVLGFEPAHFVMERRMLLGIKARAERVRSPTASCSW